jgi:hypothetical protein
MTTRNIRTEEKDGELSEKDKLWNQVLIFLVGEFFGKNILEVLISSKFKGGDVAPNETCLKGVSLAPFERRIYDYVDGSYHYLRDNGYLLPKGELEERQSLSLALKEIFWSVIRLNHPEILKFSKKENTTIGIRKGYEMVYFEDPRSQLRDFLSLIQGEEE